MTAQNHVNRAVAVIPAVGASELIPQKHIKQLVGRPLVERVICSARDSGVFKEVYVSTDDDRVEVVALACGAKVHKLAAHTGTNHTLTESGVGPFVDAHPDYDIYCLIKVTSPLIVPADFREAMQLFSRHRADSLVTAVRAHRFLWSVGMATRVAKAKNYEPMHRPRRQDWDGEFIENDAFYLFSKAGPQVYVLG
jgi:N-acylneuraminate cytidylyltransferase